MLRAPRPQSGLVHKCGHGGPWAGGGIAALLCSPARSQSRGRECDRQLGQSPEGDRGGAGAASGSQGQLSPALVKHARRLTLRNDDDDAVRVWQSLRAWALRCRRGAQLPCVAIEVRAGACVHSFWALMPDQIRKFTAPARLRWQVQPTPKTRIAAASTGPTDAHPLAVVP